MSYEGLEGHGYRSDVHGCDYALYSERERESSYHNGLQKVRVYRAMFYGQGEVCSELHCTRL